MVVAYEFHFMRHHHAEVELLELMVDKCGQDRDSRFAVARRHSFPVPFVIRVRKHCTYFFR